MAFFDVAQQQTTQHTASRRPHSSFSGWSLSTSTIYRTRTIRARARVRVKSDDWRVQNCCSKQPRNDQNRTFSLGGISHAIDLWNSFFFSLIYLKEKEFSILSHRLQLNIFELSCRQFFFLLFLVVHSFFFTSQSSRAQFPIPWGASNRLIKVDFFFFVLIEYISQSTWNIWRSPVRVWWCSEKKTHISNNFNRPKTSHATLLDRTARSREWSLAGGNWILRRARQPVCVDN